MWSEEELARLRDVYSCESGDVKGVREFFPGRGVRDITTQLQTLGLLQAKSGLLLLYIHCTHCTKFMTSSIKINVFS